MRIFLYEWVTGGGLVEDQSLIPPTLLAEGASMVTALAADFAAIEGAQVSVLRDMRLDGLELPHCEVVEVHSSEHRQEEITRLAAASDHTMIIAPEFDGILGATLAHARAAGGQLIAPSEQFVTIASDKNVTCDRLRQAGVPVPDAIPYEADAERLPDGFEYPAVLKPVDGAGSQHTFLLRGPRDQPPPYPWARRLERFCPGIPASVAALCGPTERLLLPPCRQHLSDDDRLTYLGGSLLREESLVRRAKSLADRVIDAMPSTIGYIGVDLVLGDAADGSEDVAIEVNPRLTTSYVGLRTATLENLAWAILQTALGQTANLNFPDTHLEFRADGTVIGVT